MCYAGNAVLVCKVEQEGVAKALRLYMTPRNNLREIYGAKYYPLELPVLAFDSSVAEYVDVVLEDWRVGDTLQHTLEQRGEESAYMRRLSHNFERYALWLLAEEWAHGDIKPDNIIVDECAELHLIDFDAMYKPSFKHLDCEEIGSHWYQHPMRSMRTFSKSIDDYPLALIITVLSAVAYDASLAAAIRSSDHLLISPMKAICGEDEALERVERLFIERGDARHYRIAQLLRSSHLALERLGDYLAMRPRRVASTARLEMAAEHGLWGCKVGQEWVLPPLYDLVFEAEQGVCRVEFGGRSFEVDLTSEDTAW